MLLSSLAWIYHALLVLLFILRLVFQDRWWWLGLLNGLTFYWFAPLLIVIPFAIFTRQTALLLAALLATALFLLIFGRLFIPRRRLVHSGEATLSAMTYNILNTNQNISGILDSIQSSCADVIAFQELNPEAASAIAQELAQSYPYQILNPQPGQAFIPFNSVISRYPVRLLPDTLPGYWKTPPRVYELDFGAQPVWILAVHAQPIALASFDRASISAAARLREEQARSLAAFAAQVKHPLIVLIDFNATDQNQAYRWITSQLVDAWREAGWGLGLTFGIRRYTFTAMPLNFPILLPRWLLRIDYVFHTRNLKTVQLRLGQWDGFSDHRPVIASLQRVAA